MDGCYTEQKHVVALNKRTNVLDLQGCVYWLK